METFRKIISLDKTHFSIQRTDKTLLIGSCFSQNISKKLLRYHFDTSSNPHGVIFNPISIIDVLHNIQQPELEPHLYYHNQIWHSWEHNSTFSSTSKDQLITNIKAAKESCFVPNKNIKNIIITLGSAWAYRLKSSGKIVANCHKMPSEMFEKIVLDPKHIANLFLEQIKKMDAQINWIFTISPVRHWKDGTRENNVSKGILHQAVHELLIHKQVTYFPSYEIIIDELRDYRFFENDMLHPNSLAIDYVWQRFSDTFFDNKTIALNIEIENLLKQKEHKPKHIETKSYKEFCLKLNEKIALFEKQHLINLK